MVSDGLGANVAYAATFNGEQDIYFLRLEPSVDCNANGVYDGEDLESGTSVDCNGDLTPDDCQRDGDGDGWIDPCDPDTDDDGVPNGADHCLLDPPGAMFRPDGTAARDTNRDCTVDRDDYGRFHYCLVNGRPAFPAPAQACRASFDDDHSGVVDLADFARFQNAFGPPRP